MLEKTLDLETKKEIAKIAMTATLGATVLTAPFLKRNKALKNIHTAAGVLLTGFALWHHLLYQNGNRRKVAKNSKISDKLVSEESTVKVS